MTADDEAAEQAAKRLEAFRLSLPGEVHQVDIARQIGVGRDVPGRVERGKRVADAPYLARVAEAYDLSPTWVITGRGPQLISQIEELQCRAAAPGTGSQTDLFKSIFDAISKVYLEMSAPLDEETIGSTAGKAVARMIAAGWDDHGRDIYIQGVLAGVRSQLERDFAASRAEPAASKRSA